MLELLKAELDMTLRLTGCQSLADSAVAGVEPSSCQPKLCSSQIRACPGSGFYPPLAPIAVDEVVAVEARRAPPTSHHLADDASPSRRCLTSLRVSRVHPRLVSFRTDDHH